MDKLAKLLDQGDSRGEPTPIESDGPEAAEADISVSEVSMVYLYAYYACSKASSMVD